MDLYGLLGICNDATLAQIKGAYRRASKRAHPDTGGDRAEFEAINLAYRILSDPEKRKRYDLTGEIGDETADNTEAKVLGLLSQMLQRAIMGDMEPVETDLVDALRRATRGQQDNLAKHRDQLQRAKRRLDEIIPRFKVRTGPNKIVALLSGHRRQIEQQLEGIEQTMKLHDAAAEMLADYSFDMLRKKLDQTQFYRGPLFGGASVFGTVSS